MLLRIDKITVRRIRQLGCAGSAIIVIGGVLAGILPSHDILALSPTVLGLRSLTAPAVMTVFIGISMLMLAWLRLGRLVHRRSGFDQRELSVTLVWWSAPLVLATPIFSRDVFSYVAQGTMTNVGIDAYQFGPAALGGPLAMDIPTIWQHTPAPYGPVFLGVAARVAEVTGESARLGVLGMKLLALVGVALLVWSVPRLARACGVDPAAALWLGVLNPLLVVHFIGDAHNDALMLGLMCAGLALALARRPAMGAMMITLGALVKAPAALGLVFLVPIWAEQLAGRARWLRAGGAAAGIATATAIVVTAFTGTGYGWIGALDTPTLAHTWTSITTDLGYWTGIVAEALGVASREETLLGWRLLGMAAAVVIVVALLRNHERVGPIVGLGAGMGAVVMLGPVMHPWYLLWAITPLAASATSPKLRRVVLYTSVAFILLVLPGGVQPSVAAFAGVALGAAVVLIADQLIRSGLIRGGLLRSGLVRGGLARGGLVQGVLDRGDPSGLAHGLGGRLEWRRLLGSALDEVRQVMQGQPIAVDAQTADDAGGDRRDDAVVAKRLARMDV